MQHVFFYLFFIYLYTVYFALLQTLFLSPGNNYTSVLFNNSDECKTDTLQIYSSTLLLMTIIALKRYFFASHNPILGLLTAATGYRPGTLRPQQPANYFQQQPNPISSTAGKIYTQPPKPQISQQYQIPPKHDIPSPTTAVNNMALIWQDSMPAKRHDLLTWQFQAMPKDKLVIKGNIVLCVENKFILGKR